MKRKRIILPILLVLLISLAALPVSCCQQGRISFEHDSGGADMTIMMMRLPKDMGHCIFYNLDEIRADDDLQGFWENHWDTYHDMGYYDTVGIDLADVDIEVWGGYLAVRLYEGDFDLDELREWQITGGYQEKEYKGVEVWEGEGPYYEQWTALMGDVVITGQIDDVKGCIDVIEDGAESMYDDRDLRDVAIRLPNGLFGSCMKGTRLMAVFEYEGLVASGGSSVKHDSDSEKVTMVCKFEDEHAAADAMDAIRHDLESSDEYGLQCRNVNVTRDGQFVQATYEADIPTEFG